MRRNLETRNCCHACDQRQRPRNVLRGVGAGEPLLLVAGFACDHTYWGLVAPALARKCRVICFDHRGIGRTSGGDEVVTIAQLAADAAGLLQTLGIPKANVAGHSMGGQVAMELALAFPDRVNRLLLLSSAARLDERGREIVESWGDLTRLTDPRTAVRLSLPWLYTNDFFKRPGVIEETINAVLANPYPPSPEILFKQSRAISAFDCRGRLSSIRCPTRVIVGAEDTLLPPAYSQQLREMIPHAELVLIERTAHGMLIETPAAVAEALSRGGVLT